MKSSLRIDNDAANLISFDWSMGNCRYRYPKAIEQQRHMARLTDYTRYDDAQRYCSPQAVRELFDGTAERFNIAHECVDRHAGDASRVAVRVAHADGTDEILTFAEL